MLRLAAVTPVFSPFEHWPRFVALLALLFFARGLVLLSVLPPLEPWDEYQHVAYMQHLVERDSPPVLGVDSVSTRLLRATVAFPQPPFMLDQTRGTGALGYEAFWAAGAAPEYREGHAPLDLYQAQHESLYYRLAVPLYRWAGGAERLGASISALRIVNLILVTFALVILLLTLGKMSSYPGAMALLGLAVVMQPLYLLNACRVANDGLAVLLASVVVAISFRGRWTTLRRQLELAVVLCLAVLAKATNLALIPFVCVTLVADWRRGRSDQKTVATTLLCIVLVGAAIVGPSLWNNYQLYGTMTAMRNAVMNQGQGAPLSEYIGVLIELPYWRLASIWTGPWIGGWSFLATPMLLKGASALVLLVMLAGMLSPLIRRPVGDSQFREPRFARWTAIFLLAFVSLGLWWHMLHSYVFWGRASTNQWYAAFAFPVLLALAFEGAAAWGERARNILGCSLLGCFALKEMLGEFFLMVPAFGRAGTSWESLRRIDLLLPTGLGVETLVGALAVSIVAGLVALRCALLPVPARSRTQ
jgi:hypothetical protein